MDDDVDGVETEDLDEAEDLGADLYVGDDNLGVDLGLEAETDEAVDADVNLDDDIDRDVDLDAVVDEDVDLDTDEVN
jgi:hypothetical protein